MKKQIIAAVVFAASVFASSQSYAQCSSTYCCWRPFAAMRSFFQSQHSCQPCQTFQCCQNIETCTSEGSCASGSCALPGDPKEYAPGIEDSCALTSAIERVNACRARYGLSALTFDVNLDNGAQSQVKMNAAYGSLFHGAGNEIIAYNYSDFDAAISSWLASPAHRAHLLNSGYTRAGAAFHRDKHGRVWCAVRFR